MSSTEKSWILYGASGYTGELIAQESIRVGLRPVLAGRSEEKIRPLAEKLGLPFRVFSLGPAEILKSLEDHWLVLNCAGPFSNTSKPLVDACIQSHTHYLDITGEIEVFESLFLRGNAAHFGGSVIIPGVGFDVVPTDCLALRLARELPGATSLELAFAGSTKPSRGTMKTMIETIPGGGRIRKEGKITRVPHAYASKEIRFPHGHFWAVSIPWGDVSTAYYSTGIPNIIVYSVAPKKVIAVIKQMRWLAPILGLKSIQTYSKKKIEKHVQGPTREQRETGRMYLWGRVLNEGRSVEAWLEVPEGYRLTAMTAVQSVKRVLNDEVAAGVWTPAKAFGADFILGFPDVKMTMNL